MSEAASAGGRRSGQPIALFVTVGTYANGFDALVAAADEAAARLGAEGFAQIGAGAVLPRALRWRRFLARDELIARMRAADVVIAHAGMGAACDAFRARARTVLAPRRGPSDARHPANDQRAFARRLSERYGFVLCERLEALDEAARAALTAPPPAMPPPSDLPRRVRDILRAAAVS